MKAKIEEMQWRKCRMSSYISRKQKKKSPVESYTRDYQGENQIPEKVKIEMLK